MSTADLMVGGASFCVGGYEELVRQVDGAVNSIRGVLLRHSICPCATWATYKRVRGDVYRRTSDGRQPRSSTGLPRPQFRQYVRYKG